MKVSVLGSVSSCSSAPWRALERMEQIPPAAPPLSKMAWSSDSLERKELIGCSTRSARMLLNKLSTVPTIR
jgi:hypothetical protein